MSQQTEPRSWVDDEPGWDDARRELRCIRSRTRARWPLALLVTLVLTGLGTFWRAQKQRTFQSTVVMRVTEDSFDNTTSPPTSNQLQQHLSEVALSRRTLFDLIEENGLYRSEYEIDPNLALETMREDIELEVVSNYFAQERYREDPPRSARIGLTYIGREPEQALKVARELGRRVAAEQQSGRKRYAQDAAKGSESIVAGLRDRIMIVQKRVSTLKVDLPRLTGVDYQLARVELRRLDIEIRDLQRDIELHDGRGSTFKLRSEFERRAMGLHFEMVDAGRPATVSLTNRERLAAFAVLAFLMLLPVAAIGVGTFDSRVRDAAGLLRLGLEPFGHVPAFQGDNVGSLRERLANSSTSRTPDTGPADSA